jgi:hypothetical protein
VLCICTAALRPQFPNSVPTTVKLLLPELQALPGDTERTAARLYDIAAETAADACKPALQLTDIASCPEPETLHTTLDSATQRDPSQDERPALTPTLYPTLPKPCPETVRLLPPVSAALVTRTELTPGAAKLKQAPKLPVWRIADTAATAARPTPRDTRHATTLSAAHTELIADDAPTWLLALTPTIPIDRPNTATDIAPVAATCSRLADETLQAS